jgi:hypothetical protein
VLVCCTEKNLATLVDKKTLVNVTQGPAAEKAILEFLGADYSKRRHHRIINGIWWPFYELVSTVIHGEKNIIYLQKWVIMAILYHFI